MKRIVYAIILVLALSACGKPGASTTIDVSMVEFMFSPNEFTVPAGQQITLNAANNGAAIHNFIIMKFGTSAGDAFGPEDEPNVYWRVELQPGTKLSSIFTAPAEVGDYQVLCSTEGHYMSGMVATLHVVAP